jgi:hopanoid biosynthesis associated protein HpnK
VSRDERRETRDERRAWGSRSTLVSPVSAVVSGGRLLVVNADDFGISRGVNRGIVEAHRRGLVTSASLMANLPAAEDALTRAATCPKLSLGLHLTLTAGRPLSPPERVPTLVDGDGRFFALGALLARLSLGRVRRADLERELAAQVAWALRHGVRPGHLDSHHHVHVHPRVAPTVLRLAEQGGTPCVRCPTEATTPAALRRTHPRDAARTVAISVFGHLLRRRIRARGLKTSGHFRGIALGPGFGIAALLRTLRQIPRGLTELMTHPGYPDAELARLTVYAEGRDRELAALTAREARAVVRAADIRLITFAEVARGR